MRLDERREALTTEVLNQAINASILSVVGWGTDAPERFTKEWVSQRTFQASSTEEEYFLYSTARILYNLNADSSATMLDHGSRMYLSMLDLSMLAEEDEEPKKAAQPKPGSTKI